MTKMFIVLLVFLSSITFASTQVQKKISELPKLYQPIKLTVGPDDNFQVDVNKEETMLTFTRKSNLSTRIFVQSPFSNDEKKLLDETADASFPVLHPNGKTIAFVYYKNDSRGDLCILENQQDTTPKCMNVEGEVESPQWINDNELIFLSRDFITNLSLIKKINIKNKSQEILEKGLLGAPAVDNEENYLAYNQQNGKKSFLVIKNLKIINDGL